ncbi:hypothetical protein E3J95_00925 [Candidatus Aerophobetes bacterium]|uniref:Uncharacterized protein n=1 Tax=Aerophobetes bacterium TaxID=2030807 RepID=A0A523QM46_UNCAE|nr:MAG: hypothetical protein E3J95_00925 [Candidatus Aerophobetes bacterium]
MRKVLVMLVVGFLVVLVLTGVALAFENEPEGFRGLKWGDPPTEDMEFYKQGALLKYYMIPNENLQLGNASLYMVLYQFFLRPEEEAFSAAALYFQGEENHDRIKMICQGKFGKETTERYQTIIWMSLKTNVQLYYDTIEKTGFLGIASSPIMLEHTAAKEKLETEKAKGDW